MIISRVHPKSLPVIPINVSYRAVTHEKPANKNQAFSSGNFKIFVIDFAHAKSTVSQSIGWLGGCDCVADNDFA